MDNPIQPRILSQKISTDIKDNYFSKEKRIALIFFLILGSLGWSWLTTYSSLAYGLANEKLEIYRILSWQFYLANPLFRILNFLDPFIPDFLKIGLFLATPGILSAIIILLIKRFWSGRPAFFFSIVFGLLPIIILGYIYTVILPTKQRQDKIDTEKLVAESKELEIKRQKTIETLKLTLPVKEPTYLPDFMKDNQKWGLLTPDTHGDLWKENELEISYNDCLYINEYRAPLSPFDSFISRGQKRTLDIGKGVIATDFVGSYKNSQFIIFEYTNVVFKIFHNGDCNPQLSEDELLKIVSSIVKD